MTLAQSPWLLAVGVILAGSAGGWVWAPYSDIVTRSVPLRQQPRVLAIITTGTSGGLVPRTTPVPRPDERDGASSLAAVLRVPGAYSVIYFAVVVLYFTYAADVLERGTLPAGAVSGLYAAIGLTGMVGVATGALARTVRAGYRFVPTRLRQMAYRTMVGRIRR